MKKNFFLTLLFVLIPINSLTISIWAQADAINNIKVELYHDGPKPMLIGTYYAENFSLDIGRDITTTSNTIVLGEVNFGVVTVTRNGSPEILGPILMLKCASGDIIGKIVITYNTLVFTFESPLIVSYNSALTGECFSFNYQAGISTFKNGEQYVIWNGPGKSVTGTANTGTTTSVASSEATTKVELFYGPGSATHTFYVKNYQIGNNMPIENTSENTSRTSGRCV